MSAFKSKWNIVSDNEDVSLPLLPYGNYNFDVDWGDSSGIDTIVAYSSGPHHTYSVAGEYLIQLSGTCEGFSFYGNNYHPQRDKFIEVTQFGDELILVPGDNGLAGYFSQCSQLSLTNCMDAPILSGDTTDSMFRACSSITTWPGCNTMQTSGIKYMQSMFVGATQFNDSVTNWDVSNVIDMSNLFNGCQAFDQPLNVWDVSSVTNMANMFDNASNFNSNISWGTGTSNVTSMNGMFRSASLFNQLLNFSTHNVIDMSSMFRDAISYNQPMATVGNTWNTSSVQNMSYMFSDAIVFNRTLNSWDVSNVTNMDSMFMFALNFNQPLDNWNVGNVINMANMFYSAKSFNQNINSWNVSNVTDMQNMFLSGVFSEPLNDWNISSLLSAHGMFFETSYPITTYSNLLTGWVTKDGNTGVVLDASSSQYYPYASDARTTLINVSGWTIYDDGTAYVPPPPPASALISWGCSIFTFEPNTAGADPSKWEDPRSLNASPQKWDGTWINITDNNYVFPTTLSEFPSGTNTTPYQPKIDGLSALDTILYDISGIKPYEINKIIEITPIVEQNAVVIPFNWLTVTEKTSGMHITANDFNLLRNALTDLSGKLVCTQYEENLCISYHDDNTDPRCYARRTSHCSTNKSTNCGAVYTNFYTACRGTAY